MLTAGTAEQQHLVVLAYGQKTGQLDTAVLQLISKTGGRVLAGGR